MPPIGPYSDWEDCVKDQLSKGHSQESADKICGALQQRLEGQGSKVQSLIFDKKRFTKSQAEAWADRHNMKTYTDRETEETIRLRQFPPGDCIRPGGMKDLAPGVQAYICPVAEAGKQGAFEYRAGIEVYDAARNLAKIFLIQPGENLNEWGVTREAIREGLNTIIGKPLLGAPKANPDGHGPDPIEDPEAAKRFEKENAIGKFLEAHLNGAAWGIAHITEAEAWEKLRSGEWKYVSPRVTPTCPVEHKGGADILPCFQFLHVAVVEDPAYGSKARIQDTYVAAQSFSAGYGEMVRQASNSVKKDASTDNEVDESMEKDCEETIRTLQAKLSKAEESIRTYEAEKTKNPPTLATDPNVTVELEKLRTFKAAYEKEKHDRLAEEVIALQAAIRAVPDTEKEAIKGYTSDVLGALKTALTGVKTVIDERPAQTGPKIPYTAGKDAKPIGFSDLSYVCTGRVS